MKALSEKDLIQRSFEIPFTVIFYLKYLYLLQFQGALSTPDLMHKFRKWFYRNNPEDDNDPLHVDNGILFSRLFSQDYSW